jgi:hypothetical protein
VEALQSKLVGDKAKVLIFSSTSEIMARALGAYADFSAFCATLRITPETTPTTVLAANA